MAKSRTRSTTTPPEAAAGQNFKFTRSPEYRVVYADLYRPRLGNGDVTLVFSRTAHEPAFSTEATVIEEQVEVVVSWGVVKLLTAHLGTLMAAVEDELGEIPVPAGITFDIDRQREAVRSLGLTRSTPKSASGG